MQNEPNTTKATFDLAAIRARWDAGDETSTDAIALFNEIERITADRASLYQLFTEKMDEIERIRALLWVRVLCGGCGGHYRYNKADDKDGNVASEAHKIAVPTCQSNEALR